MLKNCLASCESQMAADENAKCNEWAFNENQCAENPGYMSESCATSCFIFDHCSTSSGPDAPPPPPPVVPPSSGGMTAPICVDTYDTDKCAGWAADSPSQCDINPDFMLNKCTGSCLSHIADNIDADCDDKAYNQNLCAENPDYMLKNCAMSCYEYNNCFRCVDTDDECTISMQPASDCVSEDTKEFMQENCAGSCQTYIAPDVNEDCYDPAFIQNQCAEDPDNMLQNCATSCYVFNYCKCLGPQCENFWPDTADATATATAILGNVQSPSGSLKDSVNDQGPDSDLDDDDN